MSTLRSMTREIALLSILFLAGACSKSSDPEDGFSANAKVVRLNISVEPPSLDPRIAVDTTSSTIIGMLFEGLTRLSPRHNVELAMAKRVDLSPDRRTYTFTLRDARWTNGDPVTAHDFLQTWKQILDPKFPSNYAYQFHVIKNAQEIIEGELPLDALGVRALDARTLEVTLEHPTPYFLELLAHHVFAPINQRAAAENPKWALEEGEHFVSNGPFTLVSWNHHDELIVRKNPNYWDADRVHLDGIHISMVEDSATELAMFDQGELDWAGQPLSLGLPVEAIPALKQQGRLHTQPIAGVYFYMFNTEKVPFNNAKVRRAFAYAMGRERIVRNITQAEQTPAMGLVPPTMPFEQRPFFRDDDRAHARRLFREGLAELGLQADELPTITLSYNMGDHHLKIAQAIQQQWLETLGVRVGLAASEWKVYLSTLHQKDFMIGRLGWLADFNDPINFLEIFKHRESGNNSTLWENEDYIALLDRAAETRDNRKRHELLVKAERILMHEMPVAPIFFLTNSHVRNPKLHDVFLSPLGSVDFKWARFKAKKKKS